MPEALAAALRPELLKVFPPALIGRLVVIPYFPLSRRRCSAASCACSSTASSSACAENHGAALHLRPGRGRPHRVALQRSRFRRAHDRQHHHQHAAAGPVARVPRPCSQERHAGRLCRRDVADGNFGYAWDAKGRTIRSRRAATFSKTDEKGCRRRTATNRGVGSSRPASSRTRPRP